LLSNSIENLLNIGRHSSDPENHMALLLIIPCWLLLASLVIALCRAARLGDRQPPQASPRHGAGDPGAHRVARANGVLGRGSYEGKHGLVAVRSTAEPEAEVAAVRQ